MATPPLDTGIAALDERIAQAERRLLARQQEIRQRWEALRQGARQAVRPPRLLKLLVGAGLAGFVARWLRSGLAPLAQPAALSAGGRGGGLAWSELLLLAWPLLPLRWRTRISPTTAISLIALGVPLIDHLRSKDKRSPPPATVANVDLARFAGTWFVIASLPAAAEARCSGQAVVTYTPGADDGAGFEIVKHCPARQGRMRRLRGVAHRVPGSSGARFKLSLAPAWLRWLPLAWTDHWILGLDSAYTMALIGDPGRSVLQVLAREPRLPDAPYQALLSLARDEGYPVNRLVVATPGPA